MPWQNEVKAEQLFRDGHHALVIIGVASTFRFRQAAFLPIVFGGFVFILAGVQMWEEKLEWVRTKQDYRAALLCSRQNGFITAGNIMLGEIPKGWNTGKHSHGEEAIFIVEGDGFSVIDEKRYDWDTGSCCPEARLGCF